MNVSDDDHDEMSRHRLLTDRDIDAVLDGTDVSPDLEPLAHFVVDLREAGTDRSVQLPPALAALFESGIFPQDDTHPAAAGNATRRPRMRIPQAVAGLSLAAKLALVGGFAAAAAGGAAAAGSLPDPVQNAAAAVVRTVTPFEIPHNDHANGHAPDTVPGSVEVTPPGPSTRSDAGTPSDTGEPSDTGQPQSPGQPGLDTASSTPAEGHVPTEVPAVTVPATPSATAPGGAAPISVPPASVPAGPPAGVPISAPPVATVPPVSVPAGPPIGVPPASTPAPPSGVPPVTNPPASVPPVSTPTLPVPTSPVPPKP